MFITNCSIPFIQQNRVSFKGKDFSALENLLVNIRTNVLRSDPSNEYLRTLLACKSTDYNSFVRPSNNPDLLVKSTNGYCNLDDLFKRVNIPQDITLYRAMSSNDFGLPKMPYKNFLNDFYTKNKTVVVPIYMPTSLDINVAQRFIQNNPDRFLIKLNVPKDSPGIYMERLTPGDVYDNEMEVILPRNCLIKWRNLSSNILDAEVV